MMAPIILERVLAAAEASRDDSIALLRALIAAQKDGEAAVQAVVAERLAAVGASVEHIVYEPSEVPLIGEFAAIRAVAAGSRASVVGRLAGTTPGSGRSLILFAHPDSETVPAETGWRHDPFAGAIEDGRLYGWGVADDLLGVAAGIAAMAALVRAGARPGAAVVMASTPSKRHARGVAAILHRGLSADAAVYLHPAESGVGLNEIKAFASGQLEFRITVDGRAPPTTEPGHTAFAHLAVNPLDKALVVIAALRALDARRAASVHHPRLDSAIGRSTNLLISNVACGDMARFGRVNPSCTLGGAISFPPTEAMEAVQAQVEAAIAEAAQADDWLCAHPPRVEWVSGVTGMEIAEDHLLYRTVSEAVTAVSGIVPRVNPMHTSSDIRNPVVQKGIPTVGLGPLGGSLTQVGATDEWVDVEDYIAMIKVTASIIVNWTRASA
jgi:acetylornithine deacetylase